MRQEELELLAAVKRQKAKQRRIERTLILKKELKKKLEAKSLRNILRMLKRLSLEDLEMEIEEIGLKVLDMMELDEDQGENDNDIMMYEETMVKCEVPENMEGISHRDNNTMTSTTRDEEQFMDITTMVAFWERQEDEEPTPVQEANFYSPCKRGI